MFPDFANSGDWRTDALEVASFLAMHSQETGGGWTTAPCGTYAWGGCFVSELGCEVPGSCSGYNSGYQNCIYEYGFPCDPVPGNDYFGRGSIQVSYPYNYALLSHDLFGDPQILLRNPEQVATNATLAYASGLWFWMKVQRPKDSCHEVVTGQKTYDRSGNQGGFGLCTMIINGGIECGGCTEIDKAENRFLFLQRYAYLMGVPLCRRPNDILGCAGTANYDNVDQWSTMPQNCNIDHSLCERSNFETCPDLDGTQVGRPPSGACDGSNVGAPSGTTAPPLSSSQEAPGPPPGSTHAPGIPPISTSAGVEAPTVPPVITTAAPNLTPDPGHTTMPGVGEDSAAMNYVWYSPGLAAVLYSFVH
eukprot:Gregarina_sp_Poly_1__5345@NODE_2824_length_1670_cov_11_197130_g1780_i0_p1_GENE_NODE_2824_length_1670_cov_11_197130_g1780_i0NODE_2824_length_1670_cov_11_197130_g1780_i0_p1_ORF_typecomplete_len362_score24_16Glyco_hydro_19/PF00182_19/6_8e27Hormone_5/PF00184_17/48Hormone_5/PF00184_17/37_NODE_2824_length_1670_cov_11_197130_g1780_i05391624